MNTEKLHILVQAIEEGSLTAVAEKLNFIPTGISRAIESLEAELGTTLLHRSKAGVKPTAICELLLPELQQLLRDEASLLEHTRQLTRGEVGTIRIGSAYAALYPQLANLMAAFRETHPGVQYEMKYGFSSDLLEMTAWNELDFCVVSQRDWDGTWIPLFSNELVAMLPPNHRYANSPAVPVHAFSEDAYIDVHAEKETDNARLFREYDIHPKKHISTEDSSAMYSMVEVGFGIAMNNQINTIHYTGDVVILPLDPPKQVTIGIASTQRVLPIVKEFIHFIISQGFPQGVPGISVENHVISAEKL